MTARRVPPSRAPTQARRGVTAPAPVLAGPV